MMLNNYLSKYELGFERPESFSRLLNDQANTPPREFRKSFN